MGYIKLACPSCGANIELDDSNAKNERDYYETVYSKTFNELCDDKRAYDKWLNEMNKKV